jgi:F-type H+-transporting ATPase subunit gamma
MADARSIKRRIKTAKNIAQITQAMEMVAASKMRKAQEQTTMSRPYSSNLNIAVKEIAKKVESNQHKFLNSEEGKNTLIVLIGPGKGLCGSLISNLQREVILFKETNSKKIASIAVGRKAKDITLRLGLDLVAEFPIGLNQPTYELIVPISKIVSDEYIKGNYQKVYVVFTEFVNTLSQRPLTKQLLPIEKDEEKETINNVFSEYIFEPNSDAILESLFPHYVEMQLYQLLLEAYASEQSARMMAMKNATDNAKDIMDELTLSYNKIRQSMITNEIADIATASMVIGAN